MLHTALTVPYFAQVNMDVLLDLNVGTAIGYIPLLAYCQQGPGNLTYNMSYFFQQLYDPSLNFTTYEGQQSAPWDL